MPKLIRGTDRKTLRRFGGKLQTTNCRSRCCAGGADCATIQRYNRCAPLPNTAECQTNPDHLWLCIYLNTPNGQENMPPTIKEGNSCYFRTDTIIPTAQIPVGDVLLTTWSQIYPTGCDDPSCTECQHYYLAEPCPGQNMSGIPPVFMFVQDVPSIGAGEDCPGFNTLNRCYTIRPGVMYTQAEVNAVGGVVYTDGVGPLKCCECVEGCAAVPVPTFQPCGAAETTINLRCCCSDTWSATITATWIETTTSTGASGDIFVFTRQASGTVVVHSNDPPGTLPTIRVLETATKNGQPDPSVITQDHDLTIPFAGVCPPGPLQWRGELGTGFCPAGGPFRIESGFPGTYQEVVRADGYLTCNTLSSNYHYRTFEAGEQRIDNKATLSILVRHTGRCGGGCGQATGQAPDPSGRVVAQQKAKVVPFDKWPLLVKMAAMGKADVDMGVGDTIARIVGPAGGDLFKAKFKELTGRDCGCADRQLALNQMYPYPK